jgi:hypothetical protein
MGCRATKQESNGGTLSSSAAACVDVRGDIFGRSAEVREDFIHRSKMDAIPVVPGNRSAIFPSAGNGIILTEMRLRGRRGRYAFANLDTASLDLM